MSSDALQRYVDSRDPEAFRELVANYQDLVYGTCRRVLGDSSELDDVVQETFIKLARRAGAIRSNVGSWLHTCARTTALDALRQRIPRRQREKALPKEPSARPASDHDAGEDSSIVDACLSELEEQDRDVVVSYFFVEHSQDEIARRLGVNQGTVQRRIDRVLEILRRKFIDRGLVVPGLLAAFFADLSAESRVPSALARKIAAIEPVLSATSQSAPLAVAVAKSALLFKVLAAGVLFLAVAGGGAWWSSKTALPPLDHRLWSFAGTFPSELVTTQGDWQWQPTDGGLPAGITPLASDTSAHATDTGTSGTVLTLPKFRFERPLRVIAQVHAANRNWGIALGWVKDPQHLTADYYHAANVSLKPDSSNPLCFYLFPEIPDYVVYSFEDRLYGMWRNVQQGANDQLFLFSHGLVLESLAVDEVELDSVPEGLRHPDRLAESGSLSLHPARDVPPDPVYQK